VSSGGGASGIRCPLSLFCPAPLCERGKPHGRVLGFHPLSQGFHSLTHSLTHSLSHTHTHTPSWCTLQWACGCWCRRCSLRVHTAGAVSSMAGLCAFDPTRKSTRRLWPGRCSSSLSPPAHRPGAIQAMRGSVGSGPRIPYLECAASPRTLAAPHFSTGAARRGPRDPRRSLRQRGPATVLTIMTISHWFWVLSFNSHELCRSTDLGSPAGQRRVHVRLCARAREHARTQPCQLLHDRRPV
jgi:hypothetical protein